jgi:hypothetical protein
MTTADATQDRHGIEHALATLRLLYPEPWAAGGDASISGVTERRDFVLLPTARQPRLLLPAAPRRVLAGAVDQQLTGSRRRTRVARRVLRSLARAGAARSWPARLGVHGPENADSFERWLEDELGLASCRVAINIGRPRANRKPVVQVLDDDGHVQAYVKLGVNELTSALIDNEAAALDLLGQKDLPEVAVPSALAYGKWRELTVLALAPVPTVGDGSADRRVLVRAAVTAISGVGRADRVRWRESAFRDRLLAAITDAGARVAELRDEVGHLDSADDTIDLGSWHGDFNPGNFAVNGGRLVIWDWERFEPNVPVGFDLLHHDLHEAITRHGRDPHRAAVDLLGGAQTILAEVGVDADAARTTARSYLAWLACRYVRDRQDQAGSRLGGVEDWLLPALRAGRGN